MLFPTPRQMKTIEENSDGSGISYRALMENAGEMLTLLINQIGEDFDLSAGAVILCGSGNNGGDGFVTARLLAETGIPVTVALACGDPSTELAALEYMELSGVKGVQVIDINDNIEMIFKHLSSAAVIVDAVFGTGYHGFLPQNIKDCFDYADRCSGIKIAADVPSGGDCLRGTVAEGTMKCSYTVTFGYKKVGMLMYPLADYCGEIITADIGFTDSCIRRIDYLPTLFDGKDLLSVLPKRHKNSYKGDFGKLLNVAGCSRMRGAAMLSTKAALRCGTGLVTLASPESVIGSVAIGIPEATYLPVSADRNGCISEAGGETILKNLAGKTAVSVGCGLAVTAATKTLVRKIIKEADCPIILDADGINCIADNIDIIRDAKNKLIITPHTGELARLLGNTTEAAAADRLTLAVNLAREYNIIIVAKGVPTFVVGDGKVYAVPAGNPGLSKGGSGDVLTGVIAALCAQGVEPMKAAAAGVYIHGAAADEAAKEYSEIAMLPSDVADNLSFVFKNLNNEGI